ncbi:MAG: hypothetical protein MRY83_08410, partial [Flavobacteriales bacterium]|nr:hypothetical protein [Flavobacteriales bacterium]
MHKFLTFILLLSFKGFMAQLFVETQKIQSPDTVQYAYFGRALAISDGYLAASGNNAVHIYKRDAQGVWTFLRTINGTFGYQMDMSNDILAIEGNDEVHIYYRDQGGPEQWGWVKTLSSPDPNNEVNFPAAIDLWQDFLAISDDKAFSNSGRVYLFEKNLQGTDNWGKVNTFAVSGSDDLGTDVSIGGGKLAIGYPLKSGTWSFEGEVRIYDQNTGWGLDKVLSKSGAHGSYDMFGKSISIDDDKILVGANLGGPGGGFFHAED